MSKLDDLNRTLGANIDQSVGLDKPANSFPPGLNPTQALRPSSREQGVARSKDALVIPIEKIQPDPDQPREEFEPEALDRLAESLKVRGQLQPIRVRWDEGREAYVIIIGERRWRAAVQASLPTMSCVVHDGSVDSGELLALQLVENALREDLKPVEQAKAFRRLMEANGWSGPPRATELAVPPPAVAQALARLTLPDAVQARVEAGALAARTAYEISKLPDAFAQVELAEQAAAGGATCDQVQATVKARRIGKAAAAPAPRREFKYPDGAKVSVTLPPGASGTAAYLEMVQRAAKDLRAELKAAAPDQAA